MHTYHECMLLCVVVLFLYLFFTLSKYHLFEPFMYGTVSLHTVTSFTVQAGEFRCVFYCLFTQYVWSDVCSVDYCLRKSNHTILQIEKMQRINI